MDIFTKLIGKPLGALLRLFAFNRSFAIAVFLFTVLINVVLIPLSIKSQKSSVQQTRIKPKLDELKKRYGNDRQKMAQAQQDLYRDENVSMAGGCLPMLLRLVLMISIYGIILSPMTYMMNCTPKEINTAKTTYSQKSDKKNTRSEELTLIDKIRNDKDADPALKKKVEAVDFDLFGINLTETPSVSQMFSEPTKNFIWLNCNCYFILTRLRSPSRRTSQNRSTSSVVFLWLKLTRRVAEAERPVSERP
ncbi:MAG: YidC/Oxa1 family membrane protein insertase, partial [Clostridia bacterium]|nr:YidC/Oxa1 family membrane protein insertase [Clostridia bacterium]